MGNTKLNKLKSLFRFIKSYDTIKNPVILDLEDYHFFKRLNDFPSNEYVDSYLNNTDILDDENCILKVKRPIFSTFEPPVRELRDWILEGYDDFNKDLDAKEYIEHYYLDKNENKIYTTEFFYIDTERIESFKLYNDKRILWIEKEKQKEESLKLYNTLFEIYSKITKGSSDLDLYIADGIFIGKSSDGEDIKHPLYMQHIKIDFDTSIPEFKLKIIDSNFLFYEEILRKIPGSNMDLIRESLDEFEKDNIDIFDARNLYGFFSRFVNALSQDGVFAETNYSDYKNSKQCIVGDPILLITNKNFGFTSIVDSILNNVEELEDDSQIDFISDIILGIIQGGVESISDDTEGKCSDIMTANGYDEKVLLTKPANKEQLRVVKTLEQSGSVLVQGPPGTGKTHTIANVLGHLLSEGKRVLVTSHTEKALDVLKDKLEEGFRSLCISIMSSEDNRKEMNKNLDIINQKRGVTDLNLLQKEVETLTSSRIESLNKLNNYRQKILMYTRSEYTEVVFNSTPYTPVDMAKYINKNKSLESLIPEPIDTQSDFPLSDDEVSLLYSFNGLLTIQEEKELKTQTFDIEKLPDLEKFKQILSELESDTTIKNSSIDLNQYLDNKDIDTILLKDIVDIMRDIKKYIGNIDNVRCEILNVSEGNNLKVWQELITSTLTLKSLKDKVYEIEFNNDITLNNEILNESDFKYFKDTFEDNSNGVSTLKSLFKPKLKKLLENILVNGKSPSSRESIDHALIKYEYLISQKKLLNVWQKKVFSTNNTALDNPGIDDVLNYLPKLQDAVLWNENVYNSFVIKLNELGFLWTEYKEDLEENLNTINLFDFISQFVKDNLLEGLETLLVSYRIKTNTDFLENLLTNIKPLLSKSTLILNNIFLSIESKDVNLYSVNYSSYIALVDKLKYSVEKFLLLNKLGSKATIWAKHIEERQGIHGETKPHPMLKDAWLYIRIDKILKKLHCDNLAQVQDLCEKEDVKFRKLTSELVEKKAWKALLEGLTPQEISSIEGFRQTINRIGKGTGKRAGLLKEKAKELMANCQKAIPVWIMPLNKVYETFDINNNQFDVVIIDEASQSDIRALVALYLGKKVMIVGDHEQVSPLGIGENLDEIQKVIDTYLGEITNHHLYTGEFSIYELAMSVGLNPIMLTEHFRCRSKIIEFSNQLSYNGQIKPLRDDNNVKINPQVIGLKLQGTYTRNKINPMEAKAIVSIIMSLIDNDHYNSMSIGVITLLGEDQAKYIDNLLRENLEPKVYVDRQIQCGNSANFQGDERDVIFLSVVDSPSDGPLWLKGFGSKDMNKKRYNVAASRAKNQMWIVHSIDPAIDLKQNDIRRKLIEFGYNYDNLSSNVKSTQDKSDDSPFEKEVISMLINKGYKLKPQWQVGAFTIDIVAMDNNKRIAIECDGEKYHGIDKLEDDLNRQFILERLGWEFIRIRGSEFYKDKELTINNVDELLGEKGIQKILNIDEPTIENNSQNSLLVDTIKLSSFNLYNKLFHIEDECNPFIVDHLIKNHELSDILITDNDIVSTNDAIVVEE